MYVDKELLLSDAQDLSQSAGSYYSTYAINLGGVVGDPGPGNPLYVVICVDEAFVGSGAHVTFAVIDELDSTLDSGSVVIVQTAAIAVTSLTKGKIIAIPLPKGLITQQYLGLKYTIADATTTAGTVTAFLAMQPPLNP